MLGDKTFRISPNYGEGLTFPLFIAIFSLFCTPLLAQSTKILERKQYPKGDYISPMQAPITLSGSFGSVRKRHFHAGTDMRTNNVEGEVVRAVMDGRIIRINASTSGYGNCLYVQHPNGVVSVYGHLQAFNPSIEAYVRKQQYAQKKAELELYPSAKEFVLKQGDLLGWSGNTGGSEGPHLHFELRLNGGTLPYNSYLSGIQYDDRTAPTFRTLYLYNIDEQNYEATFKKARTVKVKAQKGTANFYLRDTMAVATLSGFGVEITDFVNRRSLTCNITELECYLDGERIYRFDLNAIAFDETSYADAHIDYALRARKGKRIHLLFQQPGNLLSRYTATQRGLISTAKDEIHSVRIRATDAAGNSSELAFTIRGTGTSASYPTEGTHVAWKKGGTINEKEYQLTIPAGALFSDLHFKGKVTNDSTLGAISPCYELHTEQVGLRKNITFSIPRSAVPADIPLDKVYLARWNRTKKRFSYHSIPTHNNNWFVCKTREFGTYALFLDTVPPYVINEQWDTICAGQTLPNAFRFDLVVRDSSTSVSPVHGTIDGKWALWESEPKEGYIWHQVDTTYMPHRERAHELHLLLQDAVGNKKELNCRFYK